MKIKLLLLLLLLACLNGNAQLNYNTNRLRVQDPLQWSDEQGSIDQATLSIKPKGTYLEYGLYLTFSAKNTYLYNSLNNLEIRYNFELPEDAIVTDSWLWVDTTIMQAKVMDRTDASTIYEGYVIRRKDPSLLVKNGERNYQLQIYPMLGKQIRKVKITYLLPINWQKNNASAALPLPLITTSLNPLPNLSVIAYTNAEYMCPAISGVSGLKFHVTDTSTNTFLCSIPFEHFTKPLTMNYTLINQCDQKVLFKYFQDEQAGFYYQLAVDPSDFATTTESRKLVFVIDYDVVNTSTSLQSMMQKVKNYLNSKLSAKDSFNLLLSNTQHTSSKWLPVDAATIESAFNNIDYNYISGYSNLSVLLNNGIDFIKENSTEGNIVLVSNSVGIQSKEEADKLLAALKARLVKIKVYCSNNYSQYNALYNFNNNSISTNQYFYDKLCEMTGGKMLDQNLLNIDNKIENFEVHSSISHGYSYDRTDNLKGKNKIYSNQTYLQTGKFVGDFPVELKISGIHHSKHFLNKIIVNKCDAIKGDLSVKTAAIGNQINELEKDLTYEAKAKVLELSIANRILSTSTAFLALEPSTTEQGCRACVDETPPVPVNRNLPSGNGMNFLASGTTFSNGTWLYQNFDTLKVVVFPNPIVAEAQIFVTMPEGRIMQGSSLQIANLTGAVVRTFDLSLHGSLKQYRVLWDGLNDAGHPLPNGVYYLIFNSPEKTVSKNIFISKQ